MARLRRIVAVVRAELGEVLPAYGTAKVLTLAAMLVAIATSSGSVTWRLLHDAFAHWDAISYLDIAGNGYPAVLDYHDAFLPGFPLLIKAVSLLTGDLVVAGIVVSAIAELAALVAVRQLVLHERDVAIARFAVWATALAPLGFFLSGVYSESTFIAGAALALFLVRSGHLRGAALAAAFATAMRLTGLVLLPVMLVELVRQRRLRRGAVWLALAPAPLLLYGAYMQVHTGDGLAFLHAQALPSFGEAAAWPWDGFRATLASTTPGNDPVNIAIFQRELAAGVAGLVLVVAGWLDRRYPRSLALYCTLVWLMAVSLTFWRSVPRYDLALFPAVIVVADLSRRAHLLRPLLVTAAAVVLAWGAFTFAEGGWIG